MESIEKLFPHDLQDKILILVIAIYFSNSVARSNFSFPWEKVETFSARELSLPGQVIHTYDLQCIIGGVRNYVFVTYFSSE